MAVYFIKFVKAPLVAGSVVLPILPALLKGTSMAAKAAFIGANSDRSVPIKK